LSSKSVILTIKNKHKKTIFKNSKNQKKFILNKKPLKPVKKNDIFINEF
jgi:hypothetical protein